MTAPSSTTQSSPRTTFSATTYVWDPTEPGLNGWTIDLFDSSFNLLDTRVTTNDSFNKPGFYDFVGDVVPGMTYYVCEELQLGWTQTFPNALTQDPSFPDTSDVVTDQCPGNAKYGYKINLGGGESQTLNDFGNTQALCQKRVQVDEEIEARPLASPAAGDLRLGEALLGYVVQQRHVADGQPAKITQWRKLQFVGTGFAVQSCIQFDWPAQLSCAMKRSAQFWSHRQEIHAHSGCSENAIGDGCRGGNDGHFAHPAHTVWMLRVGRLNDHRFDVGKIQAGRHPVIQQTGIEQVSLWIIIIAFT